MTEDLVRPRTLAWIGRQLDAGETVLGVETLTGGITAEMRRLTVGTRNGATRALVLRTYVAPFYLARAEDLLRGEIAALDLLTTSEVPAPAPIGADPAGADCEYPSLLMTHLPGRVVLADEEVEARIPLLARQLVTIHAVRPAVRPRPYETLSTADTAVVPAGADPIAWQASIELIRRPAPAYDGCFLHRDFQPGNLLFDGPRITGVVDWAANCWGPADLDVAHCAVNLALLHGPAHGLRFVAAYEQAGGVLAPSPDERLYWLARDAMASSEEADQVSRPWQEAGRTDLTPRVVEKRLDAYVTLLLDTFG